MAFSDAVDWAGEALRHGRVPEAAALMEEARAVLEEAESEDVEPVISMGVVVQQE